MSHRGSRSGPANGQPNLNDMAILSATSAKIGSKPCDTCQSMANGGFVGMDVSDARSGRIGYLESIRGLAAIQVVLLHAFSAFVPGATTPDFPGTLAAAVRGSPLFFLYDGYFAVFIFFILSGMVLTFAFQSWRGSAWAQIGPRAVRLAVPAFAACLLGFVIAGLVGVSSRAAGHLVGSTWLSHLFLPPHELAFLLKDIFVNTLLVGYQGTGTPTFLGLNHFLDPVGTAYVGPAWSLSIEFQGSLLILFLVSARKQSNRLWAVLAMFMGVLFLRSFFLCFLAGHVFAVASERRRSVEAPMWLTIGLFAVGVALAVQGELDKMTPVMRACHAAIPFMLPCAPNPQQGVAALFVFFALVTARPLIGVLSRPSLVWLGRLSFPLYLVHWPIVLGLGSFFLLRLTPLVGLEEATLLVVPTVLALSAIAAIGFVRIDGLAISLSRKLRKRSWREPALEQTPAE